MSSTPPSPDALFRVLADAAPVMIWMSGADARCTFFNQPWLAFTGRTMEQELGDGWIEDVHPEDRARCLDAYRGAFEARRGFRLEYRLRRADGEHRWVLNTGAPYADPGGEFAGYVGSCIDITDHRQAAAALRESEERYRKLVDLSPDGIFVVQDGRYVFANPAGARLLGAASIEQAMETPLERTLHAAHMPRIVERIQQVREGQDNPPIEIVIVGLDGKQRITESTSVPIVFNGRPATLVVGHDVSERRRLAQSLEQRAAEMEALYMTALEITAQLDLPALLEAIVQRAMVLAGVRMGGLYLVQPDGRLELVIALNVFPTPAGTRVPPGEGIAGRVAHSGQPLIVENYSEWEGRVTAYHELRLGRVLGVPLIARGAVIGVIDLADSAPGAFSHDDVRLACLFADQAAIAVENARLFETAQRQLAERIRVEQALRGSLREKDLLLREVHHRVKNNLQIVSSLLSLQSDTVQDPHMRALFEDSQRRIRSMALIHEQLYLSPDLGRLDFREYARSLIDHLRRTYAIDGGNVRVSLDVDDVTLSPDTAIACGLIINELVSNSLKYAFPDRRPGHIQVALKRIGAGELALRVSDDGVGLPTGADFRQMPSLGLQLVYTFSRQLKGQLERELAPGTSFLITFPYAADQESTS